MTNNPRPANPRPANPRPASIAIPAGLLTLAVLSLSGLVLLSVAGCKGKPSSNRSSKGGESLSNSQYFDNALASINKMYEFDSDEAGHEAVFYFNSWLETRESGQWKADPLIDSLPEKLKGSIELRDVSRNEIVFRDTREIREALWLRDISNWAIEQSPDDVFLDKWLGHAKQKHSATNVETLRDSIRLFDWTVRNIQLVEPRQPSEPGTYPEFDAKPGPGYMQLPEDSVLLGRADVWERAMVFLGLLHQRRIPGAVLGIREDAVVKPWVCAVPVGDEIFLFDPALGLPMVAFGEGRLVTLNELVENPELFRNYDFGEDLRYPMVSVDELVALVAAHPFSLTRGASVVQGRMTGESRWVLDVNASEIASHFTKHPAISAAKLWETPIRANIYHRLIMKKIESDTGAANQRLRDRSIFDKGSLSRARKLHIRGMFEKHDGGKPGAMIYYRELRQTEEAIRNLATNRQLLKLMDIERDPLEPEEVFRTNVMMRQSLLLASREHASYFLGLVHFETGSFRTSANWLKKRTLDDFPEGQWKFGAAYNLARARERTGEWERARQLFLLSESPQRHGDVLRARLIRTEIDEQGE
jgi:hypothetical protein